MAVCEHTICTCEVDEGKQYCSSFCEEHPEAEQCHCHHAHCEAPHHH